MNINFELYRVFFTVASAQNITRASEMLNITQPAISRSIKSLEEQLGGTLFVRTKRGVILTEEGKEFYNYIKQAIEIINNAENKFTDLINLETGIIRIGIGATLTKEFLIPYLDLFHKEFPKIEIKIYTNLTSELFRKIKEGLLDIIILNLPYESQNDIEIKELKTIQDAFIVNNNYKDLVNKKISLEELNNYPLILQLPDSNTRKFLDKFCRKNDVILKPSMELASYTLVNELTKSGFGIGYLTEDYIKKELADKKLYKLDVYPQIPKRHIGLAYSKKNLPSFSTKKLIDIILKSDI